jgi:hypothetical protein
MRFLRLVLSVLALVSWAGPGWGADLAKIERTIRQEPAYRSKAPTYCLLVFGPEAATRVWIVRDGNDLYVDRNGNGDLTEATKKVSIPGGEGESPRGYIQLGDIADRHGRTKHTELALYSHQDISFVMVKVGGTARYFAGSNLEPLRFARRPQDAPIIHFGGPMTIHLSRKLDWSEGQGQESELFAELGTPGLGKGTFAALYYEAVPPDAHPVAEIEWPRTAAGTPPKTTVALLSRC